MAGKLFHDVSKLAEIPGVEGLVRLPTEVPYTATEYACLRCRTRDGQEIRLMFAAVSVRLPCPVLSDVLSEREEAEEAERLPFFTTSEERKLESGKPVEPHPRIERVKLPETTQIRYVIGDATVPPAPFSRVIAHVCNNAGKWGAGFTAALSDRYPNAEEAYHRWRESMEDFVLGQIQMVRVAEEIWVANMIAMDGVRSRKNKQPVKYGSLERCLGRLADFVLAQEEKFSVHMPRIGCGLGGGDWGTVSGIVNRTLCQHGIQVTVYDPKR